MAHYLWHWSDVLHNLVMVVINFTHKRWTILKIKIQLGLLMLDEN